MINPSRPAPAPKRRHRSRNSGTSAALSSKRPPSGVDRSTRYLTPVLGNVSDHCTEPAQLTPMCLKSRRADSTSSTTKSSRIVGRLPNLPSSVAAEVGGKVGSSLVPISLRENVVRLIPTAAFRKITAKRREGGRSTPTLQHCVTSDSVSWSRANSSFRRIGNGAIRKGSGAMSLDESVSAPKNSVSSRHLRSNFSSENTKDPF